MLTIGINSHAVGVLTAGDAYKAAIDLPYRSGQVDGAALRAGLQLALNGHGARIAIERVSGWDSTADAIKEAVRQLGMATQFVEHSQWRSGLALADFELAPVRRASHLFPDAGLVDAHIDRAAALLLAHWVIAGRSRKMLTLPRRHSETSTRRRVRARAWPAHPTLGDSP